MISLDQKTAPEIAREVAGRVRARRRERGLTQEELSRRAGMSLASYKRFEQKGLIAFDSLVRVALALGCERDLGGLFAQRSYQSIDEVIADRLRAEGGRAQRGR
ncbi:helix-turn-helix domain-containing protein [Adlercreutzia faecimuris]|uniref:Helix-turn-helix transcriptional regulator n=1 Tax=Adlercreutzia faecimuris TaxID=2897341 RepID=A0ABS9WIE7_9ACTN|nr:helix-turn-helix transcriptional regulator [Adlercreutzia sp. JBNU-10]MCI2242650.1 helix-turn-helix transcriptional regulator [Adlercreutzia sp. JBNU-10]